MTTDLLVPIKAETRELFTDNGVDAVLKAVDEKIKEFNSVPPDTKQNRDKIRSFAAKVVKTKTFLEKTGKDFVAEKKAEIKVFDASRKKLRDSLSEKAAEVRQPLTDYEEAEKARIEAERLAKEQIERDKRLIKEAEEKAEREAEEKIAFEKAERERIEREAKEAEEQARRDKEAAIQRAKDEAEAEAQRKEQQRLDREAAEERKRQEEKKIAEKKAANKRHQAHVNNKILFAMENLEVPEDMARTIIAAVAKGEIPYMKIEY